MSELIRIVKNLAADAETQIEYLIKTEVDADELALELDGIYGACLRHMPEHVGESLIKLDQLLTEMSGRENWELWTDEALRTAPQWAEVRKAARVALRLLEEIQWTDNFWSSGPIR